MSIGMPNLSAQPLVSELDPTRWRALGTAIGPLPGAA